MARHQSIIIVDAKMYRHFAIVTIALTACIAIFADGESRAAVENAATAVVEHEPPKSTPLKIANSNVRNGGSMDSFYAGGAYDYAADIAVDSSFVSRAYATGDAGGHAAMGINAADLAKLGLTIEQFRALPPREREAILRSLGGDISPAHKARAIERATQASLARSGGGVGRDF